jgi:hypothetical protein
MVQLPHGEFMRSSKEPFAWSLRVYDSIMGCGTPNDGMRDFKCWDAGKLPTPLKFRCFQYDMHTETSMVVYLRVLLTPILQNRHEKVRENHRFGRPNQSLIEEVQSLCPRKNSSKSSDDYSWRSSMIEVDSRNYMVHSNQSMLQ